MYIIDYIVGNLVNLYNCDDQSCLHIFFRNSKIRSFIYSLVSANSIDKIERGMFLIPVVFLVKRIKRYDYLSTLQ